MRALLLFVAACGRIAFDPQGGASGDGGASDSSDSPRIDAGPTANIVFATSTMTTGNMGGLAGADAICAQDAAAASLSGTYVAWLSTSTSNAIDRLAGSRGWQRADGEPVFDQVTSEIFNPINRDARGQPVTTQYVWTGSDYTGMLHSLGACGDWISESGNGTAGDSTCGGTQFSAAFALGCAMARPIYCFGVGKNIAVSPRQTIGRIVFVSFAGRTMPGVAPLDAICQSEATAASLPGTYRAAIATTTASASSRFTMTQTPWVRVDGTKVADGGLALFQALGARDSFVNQLADGTYTNGFFWSGANDGVSVGTVTSTCNDWLDTTGNGINGKSMSVGAQFWTVGTTSCASGQAVLCLQE